MKNALRILASLAVSAGILALLFREAEKPAREVAQALWAMGLGVWVTYALAQVVQGWLRAMRYRLLLQGAGVEAVPGRGRMFGVTLARNMFVDLLPMRAGELAYWALLNRGEKVKHEDCASSMALSIWFDFLAMMAVLGAALALPMLDAQGRVPLVWGLVVISSVVAVGWVALFHGPRWAVRLLSGLPMKAAGGLCQFLGKVSNSFQQVRQSGVLGKAVALSVGIRAVKYLGLGAAFYGVARVLRPALAELPVWQVLVGLIGGEGGAALPVPTFMSMGTYEAAGSGALGLTGVALADAGLVLLGTHVASQLVDYSLGGLGLLGLLWGRRKGPTLLGLAVVAFLVLGGSAWTWRVQQKAGAKEAPGGGNRIDMSAGDREALARVWGAHRGFVIWSSTMFGNHELVRLDWPSGEWTRLTTHPFVDSTPKISPDGKRVVFARSRQEWVSFRNMEEWDIWVLDLGGAERRVAERGAEPCWTGDGQSVVFHRGGREVIQLNLQTGQETVLLGAREGMVWTGPSVDPVDGRRVAVTVRGAQRSTSLFSVPQGDQTRVDGGCQLAFLPSGNGLVWVEDRGRMKNRISRVDRQGQNPEMLIDAPGEWSHEYFPRISNDESLLVFGAARVGHEHDTVDYEIFLWRMGTPWESVARLSFHTGNDQWPDVWVSP